MKNLKEMVVSKLYSQDYGGHEYSIHNPHSPNFGDSYEDTARKTAKNMDAVIKAIMHLAEHQERMEKVLEWFIKGDLDKHTDEVREFFDEQK